MTDAERRGLEVAAELKRRQNAGFENFMVQVATDPRGGLLPDLFDKQCNGNEWLDACLAIWRRIANRLDGSKTSDVTVEMTIRCDSVIATLNDLDRDVLQAMRESGVNMKGDAIAQKVHGTRSAKNAALGTSLSKLVKSSLLTSGKGRGSPGYGLTDFGRKVAEKVAEAHEDMHA